jgi:hypothetical protein
MDEAAGVAQVLVEIATGLEEDLPEVGGCDFTDVGSDFVADLQNLAKAKYKKLAAIQAEQGSDHAVIPCFLIHDLHWWARCVTQADRDRELAAVLRRLVQRSR